MGKLYLLFAIHSHQPVGNFDHVFAKAVRECYGPFVEVLEDHPGFRLSLHFSGPLLEWMEAHEPTVIERLGRLIERGQVEIMGGGFYEPLLPYLPQADVTGQLGMMEDYCASRFGRTPQGFWLTERVWDPALPTRLEGSGLRYTVVDDTHIIYAGLTENDARGYYLTERAGKALAVFPTHMRLRYLIPFHPVEETMEFLRSRAEAVPGIALTYGDDGEKFGVWPGTREWVFGEKWLEHFLAAIEAADWIETVPLGEYLDRFPPTGRIYMPTASYEEMTEWALPVEAQLRYREAVAELERLGKKEAWRPYVRAGIWDNFLVKYAESNLMHKRMLWTSQRVRQGGAEARRELYRGQCNCAYWHGLFGGLYLKHLRQAVYERLILAERIHEAGRAPGWCELERCDYDRDGRQELVITNAALFAALAPAQGGALLELDYKPRAANLTDTLTRRREAYHEELKRQAAQKAQGEAETDRPLSIHERSGTKEEGLERLLIYDPYERRSFLDHLLAEGATLEAMRQVSGFEEGDFVGAPYEVAREELSAGAAAVRLEVEGHLSRAGETHRVSLAKTFRLSPEGLSADYEVLGAEPDIGVARPKVPFRLGVELNLSPVGQDDPEVYYLVEGKRHPAGETVEAEAVRQLSLVDARADYRIDVSVEPKATVWLWPLETVSQSDEGFERNRQGTVVVLSWPGELAPGEGLRCRISLRPRPAH